MSVWVNPSTSIASKALVGKAEEMRLATDADGYPLCQIKSTTWQTAVTSSTQITVDSWAHVVCTYDLITLKIYINGELKGTQALTAVADDTAAVWKIGKDDSASTTYGMYTGKVDDYKFFNYALTADEVKEEYNGGMSAQMGSVGGTSGTGATSNAASAEYCIPGDATSCAAPVAEWKMDDRLSGDSKTIVDTSGNGNNGTTHYGANATGMNCSAIGKYGSGCQFDGTDDYVRVSRNSVFEPSDITISLWFKSSANPLKNQTFITKRQSSSASYVIDLQQSNSWKVEFATHDSDWDSITSDSANYNDGKWHHVVAINEGSTNKLYVDGRLQSATDTSATLAYTAEDLFFGTYFYEDPTYNCFFNGSIDQVRIYNYARTPAQIAWEYNKGKPMAEWRMNECQGGTIHDESGNGNNGTINLSTSGTQTTTLGNGTCITAGSTPWYAGRSGKYGGSLNFDGTDDNISLGSTIPIINSVSLWIKPASTTQSIIDLDGGTHSISASSGTVTATGFTSYYVDGNLNGTVSDTNWHHIIAVDSTAFTTTSSMRIGKVSTSYFSGQIDEVKIFNYALTAEQVKTLYNNSSAVSFGN